jgi:RNA polymerase sigma-70 factor (ECF subfamily)
VGESEITRPSLLVRIRDGGDDEAWRQFVALYAPLVYGFARKNGLQDADAADVTQDVLRTVSAAAGRLDYDPRRGSFRGWLFTVTRNTLHNALARRRRQIPGSGDTAIQDLLESQTAEDADQAALWDRECQRRQLNWAAEQVRGEFQESTWQAFWRIAIDGQAPREVAEALGMTVGAVYIAKSRVIARLRAQVPLCPLE